MASLTKEFFMEATEACPVIPEIKNEEGLASLPKSDSRLAYIIYGDICNIADIVEEVKAVGKMAIVHVDLIVGLSPKDISIDFIKKYTKADGIISMKAAMIKRANELGMFTIQRFYMMDGITYSNVEKHIKLCNPDVVELMPAGLYKLIRYLVEKIDQPTVASGLTQDKEDIIGALKAGAVAVATTNRSLWDC
ncbi:MAG: glycerol-3-phosphate responsive antiterminator [Lachnospiraceae bacterium]|nr:glycerol-3-phosphate responsive antiterminator [Lachnospiraceae bacterium]